MADGGKVQLSQAIDGRRITVFTSPTPLTTGPVDISFLVQDEATGQVIHDERISVVCRHLDSNQTTTTTANHADSTNKVLQSAKLVLSRSGQWEFLINIESAQRLSVQVNLAEPAVVDAWFVAVVTFPVAFVGLFLLREWIVENQIRERHRRKRSFFPC
ncbi:hypothetical protein [Planctomycetes bacterium TBK1r]